MSKTCISQAPRLAYEQLTKEQLDEGLLRAQQVAALLSIGRSTLYAWVKEGRVAPGIKLGPSVTAWPRAYVRQLMTAVPGEGGANG